MIHLFLIYRLKNKNKKIISVIVLKKKDLLFCGDQ